MGIKRLLRNWLLEDEGNKCMPTAVCSDRDSTIPETDTILNFRVFPAVGNYIVEFHHYDRKTDRRNSTLYTIPHEADFGEHIAKIAGAEILKS